MSLSNICDWFCRSSHSKQSGIKKVRYGENSRRQRWRKYPHHGWPINKKSHPQNNWILWRDKKWRIVYLFIFRITDTKGHSISEQLNWAYAKSVEPNIVRCRNIFFATYHEPNNTFDCRKRALTSHYLIVSGNICCIARFSLREQKTAMAKLPTLAKIPPPLPYNA